MLRANSTALFLTAGLLGATVLVAYGMVRLMPEHHAVQPADPIQTASGTPAVIAKHRIRRGELIKADDLDLLPIFGDLPPTATGDSAALVGKIAVADLAPYQLILGEQVSTDPARAGMSALVPQGYRAIQLRTTDEIAVGNFVRPGDHVDVVVALPEAVLPGATEPKKQGNAAEVRNLLQDVTVLAVGEQLGASGEPQPGTTERRPEPPHGVTLALLPEQAVQLALGRSLGTLFLTLRNTADGDTIAPDTMRLADIRGAIAAPATAAAAAAAPARRPIELIAGGQTRTIYSQTPGAAP